MTKVKKPYIKPEITQIDLKGEEIFLSNCKLSSGSSTTSGRASGRCSNATRCRTTRGTS